MTFKIARSTAYPDRHATLTEYVHEETGFRHFHLSSEFPELVFSLSLPTPPADDTGMPHILEHLTLCGSHKYPVKDPFMAMAKRSVAHDMNAMTSKLHTTYYFKTTLEKDFLNLSDLYLDLVFCSLLRQSDFHQEGWRYQANSQGQPELAGVVLNEMKGAYSSGGHSKYDAIFDTFLPGTAAAFSSGGHPVAIPGLEYERLKAFHEMYYRPEVGVLSTAGDDIPLEALHQQLEEVIQRYKSLGITPPKELPPAPPHAFYKEQVDVGVDDQMIRTSYPGKAEEGVELIFNYTKPAPQTAKEELYDQIMSVALFNTAHSPIVKIFDQWGLGSASAYYMFDYFKHVKDQVSLMISVEGLEENAVADVPALVSHLWMEVIRRGVTPEDWQSAVLSMEKSIQKSAYGSADDTAFEISKCAVLGIDPIMNADNVRWLEELRSTPPSQSEVEKWCSNFLNSPSPVLHLSPNPELLQTWDMIEKKHVEKLMIEGTPYTVVEKLSSTSVDQLPILSDDELKSPHFAQIEFENIPSSAQQCAQTYYYADAPTAAARVRWDLGALNLSTEEYVKIKLWSSLAGEMGTRDQEQAKHAAWEDKSGVSVSWGLAVQADLEGNAGTMLTCAASFLPSNSHEGVQALMDRTAGPPVFELDRWKAACQRLREQYRGDMSGRDRQLASVSALSPFSPRNTLIKQMSEFEIDFIPNWLDQMIENPARMVSEWQKVWKVLEKAPRHIVFTGTKESAAPVARVAQMWVGRQAWDHISQWSKISVDCPALTSEVTYVPTTVMNNFCYQTSPGPRWGDRDAAAVSVALNLIDRDLHELVREQGSAYGVSASWASGIIVMSSYRDPNLDKTFDVFARLPEFIQHVLNEKDETRMHEAKLSIYQDLAKPRTLEEESLQQASRDVSSLPREYEEQYLADVGHVTWEDVARVAQTWLAPNRPIAKAAAVPLPKIDLKVKKEVKAALKERGNSTTPRPREGCILAGRKVK